MNPTPNRPGITVVTPGHCYELPNYQHPEEPGQLLQFVQKEPSLTDPTELILVEDGTTTEDVLTVLIDRLAYLQDQFPCRENEFALSSLQTAKDWLEARTRDRVARGVEGHQLT
jgi:hypothetical protein